MQQYSNPPAKTRRPVLIFLKVIGPPIVMYVDDPDVLYSEIREIIASASEKSPKLIDKTGKGPLKKLSVLDTQIAGVAIQEEIVG